MSDIKPDEYDLVHILMENEKIIPAWWTGFAWDGRRNIDQKKVIAWRPVYQPKRKGER